MTKKKKVVILGGGLSGLTAGEILSKKFMVEIYEAAPFLGGLAATFKQDGKRIPMFYHHIIKSNKFTQKYLKNFGKVNSLEWGKIRVGIGHNKKISIINSVLGLGRFDYLSIYEKFRFGLFGIYTLFFMNPNKIPENLDAETWLNKYVGKSVTDKIFFHLYSRNKFNIPLKQISAKQFAHRLWEKEIQDYFSFPKESYQGIVDGLEKSIKENGGKIKVNSKIKKIKLEEKYIIEGKKSVKYDFIINTIPFEVFINLSEGLPNNLRDKLSRIKYCPGVGICFATKDFLKPGIYWVNLFGERIHIIMQHSVLCDNYEDKISWCLRYGGSEDDLNLSEDEIKKEYLGVIKKYFPDAEIKWAKVFRTKFAEPIYDINYHKNMPNYNSGFNGLFFSGIQMTYPKIRNMNVAIESGIKVAEEILKEEKL